MTMMPSHVKQTGALPLDGWIEERGHNFLLGVQCEDNDLGDVIYNASYLKFAELARSGDLRYLVIFQEDKMESQARGHAFVVVGAEIHFKKAAGLGSVLSVCTKTTRLSRLRLTSEQTIKTHGAGHNLAGVFVDLSMPVSTEAAKLCRPECRMRQ